MRMARAYDEEDHPLSERGIEQQNEGLLRRYRDFRRGADAVTTVWRAHPEVIAVSLIGSAARTPWKEVPRFEPYRRARIALWHECKDVDLALWLDHLDSLDALRRARARALRSLWDEATIGIASHQVDVFILEPVTDRYLGRLCDFNACPKGKTECRGRAAGMWRCCVSTRGSGGERRAWPRAVRSGCSNARRGCSAARAIWRFSRSRLGDRVPDGMGILSHVNADPRPASLGRSC